jgi:LmbE family N-acetylglucosaminyl deacetylase
MISACERTLIVAAHPDDEILGAGATMKRLANQGTTIQTVILGEGKTSRDEQRNREARNSEISHLRDEVRRANELVGVADVHVYDLPDNRFDSIPLLDVVKVVERHFEEFQPTAVLTHFADDMNVDHTVTNRAVLTAARPLPGSSLRFVAAFEVLSSTGWYYPYAFAPNMFVSVDESELQAKVDAMSAYQSELREFPHPRSLDAIRDVARYRGASVGEPLVEAFSVLRFSL